MNKLFAENTQLKYDLNRNQKLLNEMKEKECSNQSVIISPMNIQIEQLKTEIQNLQTKNHNHLQQISDQSSEVFLKQTIFL